jgi:uncharacterized membrane protein HdeD (DUF308 family)
LNKPNQPSVIAFSYTYIMSSYADEGTPLLGFTLAIDAAEFDLALAKDWAYIMTAGSMQFVIGIFALCSPKAASEVLLVLLSAGLLVVGLINLLAMFFVEQSYRCASFISGAVQLTLGILMITHVFTSLVVLSSIIAALFVVEGIFRIVLALKNRDLPGWGMYLATGIGAALISAIIWSAAPTSSSVTLGILLGINWIMYGSLRIVLAFYGRTTAHNLIEGGIGRV